VTVIKVLPLPYMPFCTRDIEVSTYLDNLCCITVLGILLRVGYAFTTHSAQGMSIDKPYTIHEFNRMDKKLKYVALSRATKYENINIIM
jgi:hypothetical protein